MRNRLTTDTEYWQLKDEYEAVKEAEKNSSDKEVRKQADEIRKVLKDYEMRKRKDVKELSKRIIKKDPQQNKGGPEDFL